ncbi:unnamed protein product [Adineta ricciae]|uniref:Uncharacterized protein n=1 Tax=Adineta ricciae TaxID=249248 RepID=A0A813VEX2_ADIRI|nr:unnamed protein product [Adineta ricciae]
MRSLILVCFVALLVIHSVLADCNRLGYINRIKGCQNNSNCRACNCCVWTAWRACQGDRACTQGTKNDCTTTLNAVVSNPHCKNSCAPSGC